MEITHQMVDAALASTTPNEGPATLEDVLDFSGADTARRVVKAALEAALATPPSPSPALQEPADAVPERFQLSIRAMRALFADWGLKDCDFTLTHLLENYRTAAPPTK